MNEKKIAVITGGTGGLGKVVTEKLSDNGMKIYLPVQSVERFAELFDNSKLSVQSEVKIRNIYAMECNAESESEAIRFIRDVLKQEEHIDYLVNTVGGYHPKKNVVDMDTELIDKMINLNFKTAFYFSKNVLSGMIKQNYGRIISIGSMPAVEISSGRLAYSISKSAVVNLMQTIAEECKDYNITANTIIPSIIDTVANRKSMPNADYSKWVKPEEIAETILFLLSDSAKSHRGNIIKMYGRI